MAQTTVMQGTYKNPGEKKRAILDAARSIVEDKGLSHLSTKMVAEHAHVARGTLYRYYEDKNALIDAIADDYIEDLAIDLEIQGCAQADGANRLAVKNSIELIRWLIDDRSCLCRNMKESEGAEIYARFSARVMDRLTGTLEKTVFQYYTDHPYEMFYILIAGMARYLQSHPDADIEELTETALGMLDGSSESKRVKGSDTLAYPRRCKRESADSHQRLPFLDQRSLA